MFRAKLASILSKLVGCVAFPYLKKTMTGTDYYDALKITKPGMVFLTRSNGYLSNFFIPGYWKHAAIYCNPIGHRPCVIEAVENGVKKTDLITFLMTKDVCGIFSPSFANSAQMVQASKIALDQLGKPYDFAFQTDNEAFYCSELIYHAYLKATGGKMPFTLRETWGQDTAIPQDIANACEKWDKIWTSSSYGEYE